MVLFDEKSFYDQFDEEFGSLDLNEEINKLKGDVPGLGSSLRAYMRDNFNAMDDDLGKKRKPKKKKKKKRASTSNDRSDAEASLSFDAEDSVPFDLTEEVPALDMLPDAVRHSHILILTSLLGFS